jgi:DNA-binding transcriptional LysR family regulator
MLNPVWIQTFATVATARSFTDAGRQLGLSQSSVSDHIRRLEGSVNRRLFVRDTHSLALTPDGEALLVHARLILESLAVPNRSSADRACRGACAWHLRRLAQGPAECAGGIPRNASGRGARDHDRHDQQAVRVDGSGTLDLIVGKRREGERRGVPLFAAGSNGWRGPARWWMCVSPTADPRQRA